MSASLIDYYIKNNATKPIIARAWDLFSNGSVIHFVLHEDGKSAEIEVLGGGGVYNVFISDFKNMNIEAECTCRYSYGGLCKHSVAALYTLSQKVYQVNITEPEAKNKIAVRNTSEPLLLERFDTLSKPDLHKYLKQVHYYYFNKPIRKIHLTDSGLAFVISGAYDQNFEYITKVYREQDNYFVYCSCGQTVRNTCEHESLAIEHIVKSGKRMLQFFDAGKYDETLKNVYAKNNIPEKLARAEFVHVNLSEFGALLVDFKGPLKGLISEHTAIGNKNFYQTFNSYVKFDSEKVKQLFEVRNSANMAIGFVVGFDTEEWVQPISGKTNAAKNKIISNIQEISVSDFSELKTSNLEKEAIILCEQIRGITKYIDRNNDGDVSEDIRKKHEYLKKLFSLLAGNIMVYTLKEPEVEIRKTNLRPISISTEPLYFDARLQSDEFFISLVPSYRIGEERIDFDDGKVIKRSELIWEYQEEFHLFKSVSTIEAMEFLALAGTMKTLKSKAGDFITNIVIPFSQRFKIDIDGMDGYDTDEIYLKPIRKQVFLSEFEGYIMFTPIVIYNHKKEVDAMIQGDFIEQKDGQIRIFKRNEEYEQEFLEFLRQLHSDFVYQEQEGALALALPEMLENNWFFDAFESMKENKIEVHGLQKLKSFKHSPYRATVNTGLKSGQDWFDVNLEVSFGDQRISLAKLKKYVLNKSKFIKLDDGTMGMLPEEWVGKLENYFRVGELNKDKLQISKLHFSLIDELFDDIDDTEILLELAEKKKRLESFTEISKVKKPATIKATLRDYQKEGLNWLNFLAEMGWGGILADDMGLGKTLQILAFLASLHKKSPKTSLVILPTTLIFNWENEINKFYPSLKTMFYYGVNRQKDTAQFSNYQLVVTTYGLMVNDIDVLSKVKFNYIILDESQAIKNPLSKRYKAACLLQGNNKLTLTGTPIENNTFDLYAQMSFVNPGMLGTTKSFKEYYSAPIDKEKDPGRANELRKLITPFLLRRTKEQVATELPPKTEDVIYCQMDREQRLVYDEYKLKYRDYLLNKIDEDGLNKTKMYVLEGLLKLRQICNSPKLIEKEKEVTDESVKLNELMRQINEKTGKHKIVVFSQFVKMLKMIEVELMREEHDYEYFDGSSSQKKRRESVNRFQDDENCRVFLISLKAGGTGINLTAADYVYIFDPWWNPAVENQAIDRTYRIGQDKKVFAYRMICKDSVEEKILEYQSQKKALAADIIRTDESFVKQLSQADIKELFG